MLSVISPICFYSVMCLCFGFVARSSLLHKQLEQKLKILQLSFCINLPSLSLFQLLIMI